MNSRWRKINQFLAVSGIGKKQAALGTFLDDADLDTRENCEIEIDLEIERREERNCDNVDLIGQPVRRRYRRFRLTYNRPTAQQAFRMIAYKEGAVDAPTGTPADEVQLLAKTGTVSGGTYKLGFSLEGRSGVTKPIAHNANVAQIIAAITSRASTMGKVIQSGDITAAGGTAQVETATVVGTIGAGGAGNVTVTVRAAGAVALAAGKAISVAVANNDTASQVAGKIRTALAADADVNGFFVVSGAGADVVLTARTRAANDATMNIAIANGTTTDLTNAPTSANTTPGVAQTEFGSGVYFSFAKRLRRANVPLITVDNSLITGGGTLGVTQTTQGGQNYHMARRSSDGSKPHFSIATGDKNGSVATEKYGDCVVESVDFTMDTEQTNVQITVVLCGNFNPDLLSSFPVPACVNNSGILVEEVRLKIDGTFENRSLVNHAINLNDNVPTQAAFGFDDIDITDEFVRGDQPTQEFTTEIFGDSNHALHELALNETEEGNEVEFITHMGMPGNRVSVIADETKIKPQQRLDGFSGAANQSTIKLNATPYGITDIPVRYEAYLDQSVAFLSE